MSQPEKVLSADDFLRGQRDCRDGVPHKPNQSRDYARGYGAQYEMEQVTTELSMSRGIRK